MPDTSILTRNSSQKQHRRQGSCMSNYTNMVPRSKITQNSDKVVKSGIVYVRNMPPIRKYIK